MWIHIITELMGMISIFNCAWLLNIILDEKEKQNTPDKFLVVLCFLHFVCGLFLIITG